MKLWTIIVAACVLLIADAPAAAHRYGWQVSLVGETGMWGGFREVSSGGPQDAWVVRAGLPPLRWNGAEWHGATGKAGPYLVRQAGQGVTWTFTDGSARVDVRRMAEGRWSRLPIEAESAHVTAAAATGADDCWAAGLRLSRDGMTDGLWHWEGQAWRPVAAPLPISDLAAAPDGQVWALSSPGVSNLGYGGERAASILRWTDGEWLRTPIPAIALPEGGHLELNDLAMPYAGLGYAVGAITVGGAPLEAVVLRWDGAAWERLPHRPPATAYTHVTTDGGSGMWLAAARTGLPGALVRFVDGSWSQISVLPESSTHAEVRGLANVPGTSQMWATVDAGGTSAVLTYR
ncbi:hypothetical protein [Nonomuraea dietziae]|uniref:hypothetical protein n=1 Tax=Nonomuraea dietziae TaxID=65515 RepID=UPI00340465A3